MVENKKIDIIDELGQNFIDFSYEANSARAFADARDGLKPGQRACLWEMFDKGYLSNKPHVKSAKIAGAVTGNWWPHGDVAIYETFARMSQPWINNVPEVDWHGNNGSQYTGPECASSRYTEARLSKIAEEGLFKGIKKDNVDMILNFSEDAEWPEVLPATFPRLMVNGCQGIGSTIANVWLPHDLGEVSAILIKYMETNKLDYSTLAPSFPTGGIIINKEDIHNIYETGKGKVILRGKAEIKKDKILITELPYQIYAQPFVEKITEMAIKDEISGIEAVNNKSGKGTLLIEIECSGNPEHVLAQLYAKTDLQKNYNANQWALVGKTPRLLTLKEYFDIYIEHNLNCIKREYQFDLNKAKARLEIIEGLLIALEDIDNIIQKIKTSESAAAAKSTLIKEYKMTENQAKAVLDMKLSRLARLEKVEIQEEKKELLQKIEEFTNIVNNKEKQKGITIERLQDLNRKFKSKRLTSLDQIEIVKNDKEIATVIPEDVVVMLSQTGNIKRIPQENFKAQKRNGKGIATEDDAILTTISTNTIDTLLLFTNKGQMYRLIVDKVPTGNNTTKGVNLSTLINLQLNEKVIAATALSRSNLSKYVVFITTQGLLKKTSIEEYTKTKRTTGIAAINLKDGDSIANIELMNDEDIVIITKKGQSIHFETKDIAAIGRVTAGIKAIKLNEGDEVLAGLAIRNKKDSLVLISKFGLGKKVKLDDCVLQNRAGKGIIIYKTSPSTGDVVGACMAQNDDRLLLIGKKSICITANEVPLTSRVAIGNQMIQQGQLTSIVKI